MSGSTPPAVPAQRKVKLVTALKTTLSDQSSKLQSKHDLENELLEDIRNYAKQRANLEKDYAQGMLKMTSQMLTKMNSNKNLPNASNEDEDLLRSPYGLWRKILEEAENMANLRMKISQTLQADVADNIKNFKVERIATFKKCTSLNEKLHEEIVVSTSDVVKSQKTYSELQKLTSQAHQQSTENKEKLASRNVGLFTSRAKLEKNASKLKERVEASEKRSTVSRNEYLLTLAAMNAHQSKYFSQDLPDLIATQDGKIYENLKDYYTTISNVEREACEISVLNLQNLEGHITMLERAYAMVCFLQDNPIFTKCEPYDFNEANGDEITKISDEYGAGLPLNKEARKWTLRLVREQKSIRKKTKKLRGLKAMTLVDMNITASTENCADSAKSTEQEIDALAEEIRHLEVLRTKAEGRVEALKLAGVNVDEWLQGAMSEQDDDDNDTCSEITINKNGNQLLDDDEFGDEEWDDNFPTTNYDNFSDDGLSVSSSLDPKSNVNSAVAIYAFEANSHEELSIYVGEELELVDTEGDGWCRTRNKAGEVGFVPEAYIEIRWNKSASEDGDCLSKSSSHASSSLNDVQISDYSLMSLNNCVDTEKTPTPMTAGFESSGYEPATPTPMYESATFVCFAKAIYDYDAVESEELSFHEGDIITVTSKMVDDDDGWWEGSVNGASGVFPSLLVEETKPPDPFVGTQDDFSLNRSNNLYNSHNSDIPRSQTMTYRKDESFQSLLNGSDS